MAEFSPPSPEIVVLIAGVVLYVFIWFATRNLSRVGKILARLAPLGLVIPAMVYLSSLSGMRRGGGQMTSQARKTERGSDRVEKARERQETAGQEEASRRVVIAEEAQRRAQAEASRRAEGARRPAEVPAAGAQAPAPSTAQPRPAPSEASPPAAAPPGSASAPPPHVATQPQDAWGVVPVFYRT